MFFFKFLPEPVPQFLVDCLGQDNEPKILDLIESKLNELQLTFEDLVLIGFSQGTMMSLYLTHSLSTKIAAVVGFSGAFYPPEIVNNIETPTCLIHGTDDEVVIDYPKADN